MREAAPGHTATFSTADYHPREATAAFQELFARAVMHMNVTPLSERFQAEAKICCWPGFGAVYASATASHHGNTRELIVRDDIGFGWVRAGGDRRWCASQLGRQVELNRGDGLLMNNGELGTVTLPSDFEYVVFGIPRALLKPLVPNLDTMFARRVPAETDELKLLSRYLLLAQDEAMLAKPELQNAFARHVTDLLALCLGATHDSAELAKSRGVRAARLHAIKQDIQRALNRPDLSVRLIATWHSVTPRYVQALFDEDGSTFTRFVLEQRLDHVHRALTDEARSAVPISTLAYESGFTDLSNFNRAFRQRFGCTPTDARMVARHSSHRNW
jgi:AraC-like DNA-binding protein